MKCSAFGYEDSGGRLRRVEVAISPDQYAKVSRAQETIITGLQFEEKLNLLLENHVEWEATLLTLAQRYVVWPSRRHDEAMDERLLLDRRLVNLLTSCRLYLDQSDHTLSSFFGSPSAQGELIDRRRSSFYDTKFGYRFMEAIRNHIQHRALPISEIKYQHSAGAPPHIERVEMTVIPCVNIEDLKKDAKFKRQLIDELVDGAPTFDLRGPIREYIACIVELHDEMRVLLDPVLECAVSVYKKARLDFSTIEGVAVNFPELMRIDDELPAHPIEETPLSAGPIDRYEVLRKRQTGAKTLTRIFASNGLREP
jgi:hypothetical protein